jgi:hypothetical protein
MSDYRPSLSQRAINARRRQARLPYPDAPAVPMPPVRNVTVEERDTVYRVLDQALFATNGLRVQRHADRHHLVHQMIIAFDGLDPIRLMAEKMSNSKFLRGKRWLDANRILTDTKLQCGLLEGKYDDGGNYER